MARIRFEISGSLEAESLDDAEQRLDELLTGRVSWNMDKLVEIDEPGSSTYREGS